MGQTKLFTWIALAALIGCSSPDQETSPTPEQQAQEAAIDAKYKAEAEARSAEFARLATVRDEIVKHFESDEEPSVKGARWTQDEIFKVGVLDNGSNRNGFAQYVCNILYEKGITYEVWVQVIDIQKLAFEDDVVKLGEHWCPATNNNAEPPTVVDFTS